MSPNLHIWDESGTDGAVCSRKSLSATRVACAIRSLVNVRELLDEFTRILHETLLIPVLM